jgi:hypothetical protein
MGVLLLIYIIGGIMSIISFIALIRIWMIMEDIKDLPGIRTSRMKKEAAEIIAFGRISNPNRVAELIANLSIYKHDDEALDIIEKLEKLKKQPPI